MVFKYIYIFNINYIAFKSIVLSSFSTIIEKKDNFLQVKNINRLVCTFLQNEKQFQSLSVSALFSFIINFHLFLNKKRGAR